MAQIDADATLFQTVRSELFTCVVGDAMDKLGLLHQFLPPQIQPLRDDMVVIGRAAPVLSIEVFEESAAGAHSSLLQKPFGLMLEALDDLKPNEVYVCGGATGQNALWGELMSIRAQRVGCTGAVLNGYSRDTRGILELGFPTFSWGRYGQDSAPRLKIADYRIAIEIGGIRIRPGDVVFGDIDGVCVVPAEAAAEVFALALEKVRGERLVRQALEAGGTAVDAFTKHGVM